MKMKPLPNVDVLKSVQVSSFFGLSSQFFSFCLSCPPSENKSSRLVSFFLFSFISKKYIFSRFTLVTLFVKFMGCYADS